MLDMDRVSLDDRVDLVAPDPPYNARGDFGHSGANYDRQTPGDMEEMAMF